MATLDPDVLRWGLDQLFDVCSISNSGSCSSVTRYGPDHSHVEIVRECYVESEQPYVENDEIIARTFQEELSRVALHEASVDSVSVHDDFQSSVLAQDWLAPSQRFSDTRSHGNCAVAENRFKQDVGMSWKEDKVSAHDQIGTEDSCSYPGNSQFEDNGFEGLHIADESLDDEVGKRLNQMVPIPHIPKVNGDLPSADEEVSDHQRLLDRLQLYDLVENKIQGDGNCQFRAISDQLYRSPEYHKFVRREILQQLKTHPELYDGYVPMDYADYLKKMCKCGEWGDHVTLQAAADSYGVKIFVITSFKDTCYVEILPHNQKSKRVIFLSFWAEVHYNSIYPEGDLPAQEGSRKKRWWDVLRV